MGDDGGLVQRVGAVFGHRRAEVPARVAYHPRDPLLRRKLAGPDCVTLVLATLIIDHNDGAADAQRRHNLGAASKAHALAPAWAKRRSGAACRARMSVSMVTVSPTASAPRVVTV